MLDCSARRCLQCVSSQAPPDHKHLMSAKWGKLSCSVLAQDWDSALEELSKLKRDIDETVGVAFGRGEGGGGGMKGTVVHMSMLGFCCADPLPIVLVAFTLLFTAWFKPTVEYRC